MRLPDIEIYSALRQLCMGFKCTMKKYYKKNPSDNIWVLGLPAGSPPQAALSLLSKGSKITSITLPEWTTNDEKRAVKHRMAKPPKFD